MLINRAKKELRRLWCHMTPLDLEQHRQELIGALESLQDALLREEKGAAARRTTQIAAKVGTGAVATSAMMGIAGLFGTASTGTAIGSLTGAAFTNASLAWIGGSVAAGGTIVGGVGIAAGTASYFGAKWAWQKYLTGKPRKVSSLNEQEAVVHLAIENLLITLKQPEAKYDSFHYLLMWKDAINPVLKSCEDLYKHEYSSEWPVLARNRLKRGLGRIVCLRRKATGRLAHSLSIPIGTFSAVTLSLINGQTEFSEQEGLVLEAFRRSTPELSDASPEEIGEYISRYQGDSLDGLLKNIKGIYFEIAAVERENTDGDEWVADLMAETNCPGVDVVLRNTVTGEIREVQLKTYAQGLNEHRARYEYDVLMPDDIANHIDGVEGTGISSRDLNDNLGSATSKSVDDAGVADSIADVTAAALTAALVTLTVNIGAAVLAKNPGMLSVSENAKRAADAAKFAGLTILLTELLT